MKISQSRNIIITHRHISEKYFELIIEAADISRAAKPGQFVMLKITEGSEPLLRRPLGVHSVKGKQLSLLYEVVGKGTEALSVRKAGEYLDIIGPLGNGFNLNPKGTKQRPVVVAGGMGVAPLLFLGEELKTQKPLVLIGAKNIRSILCEKEFKNLGCEVKVATDDGSKGFKGTASALLKNLLTGELEGKRIAIYSCGPKAMLKEISVIADKHKIPAQISLEAHLACGIGACLGCVINTKSGYKRVCKEGPVFTGQEITWDLVK